MQPNKAIYVLKTSRCTKTKVCSERVSFLQDMYSKQAEILEPMTCLWSISTKRRELQKMPPLQVKENKASEELCDV